MQEHPTPAERAAMRRALTLAAHGPAQDANPQVGCVILDADGRTLGEGHHRGAGTAHAEVAALADVRARGHDPRGATAVVTLEPCAHTGRTGPCAEALIAAGVARVVHALPDPGRDSGGGAARLREAGIAVHTGLERAAALDLIRPWYTRAAARGVHLVWKTATSLDGQVAAADGASRWITGPEARAHAHQVRARADALIVGTGTALADDPALTVRTPGADGSPPWRVVVGHRPLPAAAAVRGTDGRFLALPTHDPATVLAELASRGVRHAVLEGGPRLSAAALAAGLIDELHAYLAPLHLGAGTPVLAAPAIPGLAGAPRWRTREVRRLGEDLLLIAIPA